MTATERDDLVRAGFTAWEYASHITDAIREYASDNDIALTQTDLDDVLDIVWKDIYGGRQHVS